MELLQQRELRLRPWTVTLLGLAFALPVARRGCALRLTRRILTLLQKLLKKRELLLKERGVSTSELGELLDQFMDLIVKTIVLSLQKAGDLTKHADIINVIDLKHERMKSQREFVDNPFSLKLLRRKRHTTDERASFEKELQLVHRQTKR
jgi:hypothetical protein